MKFLTTLKLSRRMILYTNDDDVFLLSIVLLCFACSSALCTCVCVCFCVQVSSETFNNSYEESSRTLIFWLLAPFGGDVLPFLLRRLRARQVKPALFNRIDIDDVILATPTSFSFQIFVFTFRVFDDPRDLHFVFVFRLDSTRRFFSIERFLPTTGPRDLPSRFRWTCPELSARVLFYR